MVDGSMVTVLASLVLSYSFLEHSGAWRTALLPATRPSLRAPLLVRLLLVLLFQYLPSRVSADTVWLVLWLVTAFQGPCQSFVLLGVCWTSPFSFSDSSLAGLRPLFHPAHALGVLFVAHRCLLRYWLGFYFNWQLMTTVLLSLTFRQIHLVHNNICSKPLFTKFNRRLSIFVANSQILICLTLRICSIFQPMKTALPSPSDGWHACSRRSHLALDLTVRGTGYTYPSLHFPGDCIVVGVFCVFVLVNVVVNFVAFKETDFHWICDSSLSFRWQKGDRPDNDLRWAMQHPDKKNYLQYSPEREKLLMLSCWQEWNPTSVQGSALSQWLVGIEVEHGPDGLDSRTYLKQNFNVQEAADLYQAVHLGTLEDLFVADGPCLPWSHQPTCTQDHYLWAPLGCHPCNLFSLCHWAYAGQVPHWPVDWGSKVAWWH